MTVLVRLVARALLPASLAVGAALWIRGYSGAGDGFSAGLLAALGACVQYLAFEREAAARATGARFAARIALVGLVVALGTVLAPAVLGAEPVTHAPGPGEEVTTLGALELHTATVFDLGVGLVVYGFVVATIDRLIGAEDEG